MDHEDARSPSGSTRSAWPASSSTTAIAKRAMATQPRWKTRSVRSYSPRSEPAVQDQSQSDRHHGFFGRRSSGVDGRPPFDKGDSRAVDPIQRVSCQPDFMILCYPVIVFDAPTPTVARRSILLARTPIPPWLPVSPMKQVTSDTADLPLPHRRRHGRPVGEQCRFLSCLAPSKVPAEMHLPVGRHGLSAGKTPGTSLWSKCCEEWLRNRGLIGQKP